MIPPIFKFTKGNYEITVTHSKNETKLMLGENTLCTLFDGMDTAKILICKAEVVEDRLQELEEAVRKFRSEM